MKAPTRGKALFVTHDTGLYGASQSLQILLRNYKFRKIDLVVSKSIMRRNDFEQLRKKFGEHINNIYELYLPFDLCYTWKPRNSMGLFLKNFLWWLLKSRFYKQLDIGQYDYIYLNSLVLHPIVREKYPFIIHVREMILDTRSSQVYQSVSKARGVIFIDEVMRQPFLSRLSGELVLNNLFDMKILEEYDVGNLKFNFDHEHKTVFCAIGSINQNKGIPFLIEAFRRLKNKDVVLVLVGDGEEKFVAKCRRLAQGDERIIFMGEELEIGKIYRVSDYVLRGEAYPCIGRTIYEGLYAGCDVVVPGTVKDHKIFFEYEKFRDRIHFYEPRNIKALQHVLESLAGKKIQERIYGSNIEECISKFESYVSKKLDASGRDRKECTGRKLEEVESISL